jgi:hypothetical protein
MVKTSIMVCSPISVSITVETKKDIKMVEAEEATEAEVVEVV